MPGDSPIIKIEDLTKPATELVKRVSDGVEGYFKPFQTKRMAKAEAEVAKIAAQADIDVSELQQRAAARFLVEEAKKQVNMETITAKAVPQLAESATPQDIDADWITNFFDKCRIVSDDDMQALWAGVLAGEANSPGSYGKRTVDALGSLERREAELFALLCGFVWDITVPQLLVYDAKAPIYNDQGIHFPSLTHLDSIGLVTFEHLAGYNLLELSQTIDTSYYGKPLKVRFAGEKDNELDIGSAVLTEVGEQLATVCQSQPVDGFYDYVREKWIGKGLALS